MFEVVATYGWDANYRRTFFIVANYFRRRLPSVGTVSDLRRVILSLDGVY
jgi:hypothetical protein